LNDILDASKSYKNFSGISEDMDGEVKFIFVTDK
jgi:putative membrane protein